MNKNDPFGILTSDERFLAPEECRNCKNFYDELGAELFTVPLCREFPNEDNWEHMFTREYGEEGGRVAGKKEKS